MWYKCTTAHIKREYWLNEHGPELADWEIGDDNHEMLAESHMLNEIGNDIQDENWGTQTYSNAKNMFYEALHTGQYLGSMQEFMEALQETYGDEYIDYADFDSYLIWLNTQNQEENMRKIQEEFVQREIAGMKDPRKHVAQHYDWVRVQGPNIEVWEMNSLAVARIKKQIEQILHDESYEDEIDEKWKDSPKLNLSILSTGKYIEGISYNDLIYGRWQKRIREPEIMKTRTQRMPTNIPGYQYDGG